MGVRKRKRTPQVILQKPPIETLFPTHPLALPSMQDSYPPPTQLKLNQRNRTIMVHARSGRTRPGPLTAFISENPENPGNRARMRPPPIEIDTENESEEIDVERESAVAYTAGFTPL